MLDETSSVFELEREINKSHIFIAELRLVVAALNKFIIGAEYYSTIGLEEHMKLIDAREFKRELLQSVLEKQKEIEQMLEYLRGIN